MPTEHIRTKRSMLSTCCNTKTWRCTVTCLGANLEARYYCISYCKHHALVIAVLHDKIIIRYHSIFPVLRSFDTSPRLSLPSMSFLFCLVLESLCVTTVLSSLSFFIFLLIGIMHNIIEIVLAQNTPIHAGLGYWLHCSFVFSFPLSLPLFHSSLFQSHSLPFSFLSLTLHFSHSRDARI